MVSEDKSHCWMQSPMPVIIGGRQRGEAKYFLKISGFAHQNLSLFTSSIAWRWVKPRQNSFSSNSGKENTTAGTGMFLNGVFDIQDWEFLKTLVVLVCPADFCQVFRAAEIQKCSL